MQTKMTLNPDWTPFVLSFNPFVLVFNPFVLSFNLFVPGISR
jgi:hypothetical protein